MDGKTKSNVIKACLIGVGGLIILCTFIAFAGKKDDKGDNLLSTDKDKSYTVDDMTKKQGNPEHPVASVSASTATPSVEPAPEIDEQNEGDNYQSENSDVKKVEKVLRQKNGAGATSPISPIHKHVTSVNLASVNNQPAAAATAVSPVVETTSPAVTLQPRHRGSVTAVTKNNVTPAVIQGEQTVKDRSTVRIRLLDDYTDKNGVRIPKNTSVFGIASIASDRLYISINSVMLNGSLFNTSASVYDMDGQKGINIQSNVNKEISNDATDAAVGSYTPTATGVAGVAASALTSIGRSAITHKQNEASRSITLKTNYKIYIQ
jgi:hypothetical protein